MDRKYTTGSLQAVGGSVPLLIEREDLSVLMAAVAEGDRLAFKHLYDRTSARLLGIVRRIVRDRALAEEVLQEVYLRIWERAATYRTEVGSALTWMISIARHRAIDVLRQRKELVLAPMDDGEDWLERVAGPGDGEADLEDRDRLRRCLQRLEEPQRSCILLAYCDGYSRDELATRYETPVNTIKTWLHRGLAVLRTCLEAP
jgi:RNA polymerase sigma-70 factor (ECF subfamily)